MLNIKRSILPHKYNEVSVFAGIWNKILEFPVFNTALANMSLKLTRTYSCLLQNKPFTVIQVHTNCNLSAAKLL